MSQWVLLSIQVVASAVLVWAVLAVRAANKRYMEQPRLVSGIVVNRHAGRLAAEVAALREVVVDGDVRGRDALDREAEGGHGLPQGVELGTDRQEIPFGQGPFAGPLGDDDSLLKLEPVLDVVNDVGEVSHDSSSVGGDGATEGDSASSPVDGSTDPTEEASPSGMRSGRRS